MASRLACGKREFSAGPWLITVVREHILRSRCEKSSTECSPEDKAPCVVCRFSRELQLPWLPEMIFPYNALVLEHQSGAQVQFRALDALKLVDTEHETVHVAGAEQWRASRTKGLQEVKVKLKPFDWTFTTDYNGSLTSTEEASIRVEETSDRIDYNKLKTHEKIAFFDDVLLFEDELADNGTSELRVKIRVMESGFFILLRFFLRVDGVLVRFNDTRLYHPACTNFMLREVSHREAILPDPRLPLSVLKDVNALSELLPHTNTTCHKLLLPDQ